MNEVVCAVIAASVAALVTNLFRLFEGIRDRSERRDLIAAQAIALAELRADGRIVGIPASVADIAHWLEDLHERGAICRQARAQSRERRPRARLKVVR